MKARIGLTHVLLTVLIAAVISVGWSQSSRGQTSRVWEYKALSLTSSGLSEDGQPIPGSPRPRIQALGREGWELVGMTSTVTNDNNVSYAYWLKRAR